MSPTVHLIDDDEPVRDALAILLEIEGFAVHAYESASVFLSGPIPTEGCVVTDVQMPGVGGFELLAQLRAERSELPVIMMTGRPQPGMANEARRLGALDFIEKPFRPEAILPVLQRAFRGTASV